MKLIVGLGNPGREYEGNRHNVGFMAVERIGNDHRFGPWKRKFQAIAADGEIAGEKVMLLKPETYMNESGRAVGEAARFLKIGLDDIIVLYDEIDLAAGQLKVKTGGGNAGHNGLRSITAHLGNDYHRVRIGVGHPGAKELVARWVLSDFAKADRTGSPRCSRAFRSPCRALSPAISRGFLPTSRNTGERPPIRERPGVAARGTKHPRPKPRRRRPAPIPQVTARASARTPSPKISRNGSKPVSLRTNKRHSAPCVIHLPRTCGV